MGQGLVQEDSISQQLYNGRGNFHYFLTFLFFPITDYHDYYGITFLDHKKERFYPDSKLFYVYKEVKIESKLRCCKNWNYEKPIAFAK